jgi:hypothetical protein
MEGKTVKKNSSGYLGIEGLTKEEFVDRLSESWRFSPDAEWNASIPDPALEPSAGEPASGNSKIKDLPEIDTE